MRVTVADCERSQTEWNVAVAMAGGGTVWKDGELRWSWQAHDRQLMLNFPRSIDLGAARRGLNAARERGACIVGAWLSADVPEYGSTGRQLLALARGEDACAWHAVARLDGHFAGHAWSMRSGDIAGVYDMEVWPQFRRRGLGRALLRAVCQAAQVSGAAAAVLNATPEGERLYSAEGFVRLGNGITYWHHLG